MPPNLEVQIPGEEIEVNDQITIVLTPISDYSSSSSELNDTNLSDESLTNVDVALPEDPTPYPMEQSFRDFLVKLTNTEDLSTVTQLKLRVISREVTLQYLSIYTPALRELTLDGSDVSSLRDLGGGLKNLKILKVNRCGLDCIDGVFGIEQLEELYVTDNEIATLSPCVFLTNLRVLDVRRNNIAMENVPYLSLCENLEELYIQGNPGFDLNSSIMQCWQRRLPKLKILDGLRVTDIINEVNEVNGYDIVTAQNNMNRNVSNQQQRLNFTVEFPPRVVLQRYFYDQ